MTSKKMVAVRLDSDIFDKLTTEAERRAVPPAVLARDLVIGGLYKVPDAPQAADQHGVAALDWLSQLRSRLPGDGQVDAVRLVREGRDELARRVEL